MKNELVRVWLDNNNTIDLLCLTDNNKVIKIYDYQKNELRINKFNNTVCYKGRECSYFLREPNEPDSNSDEFLNSLPKIE